MSTQFDKFIHIGIVCEDLDKAIANWEAIGFGPWDDIVLNGGTDEYEGFQINGQYGYDKEPLCRWSKCRNLGVELELIQPIGPSPYLDYLEEHGPGIQHIECWSSQCETKEMVEKCVEITGGRDLLIDGSWDMKDGTHLEWAYVDMRPELGLIMEVAGSEQG